jgi:lambda family phage portal protein
MIDMRERKRPTPRSTVMDRIGDGIDSIVEVFAPELAGRRRAHRARLRVAKMQATEAARNDWTRGASWLGSRLSADSELEQSIDSVRQKARELMQNDPIGGAIEARTDLIVGTGFTPQSQIIAGGEISEELAQKWRDELDTLYDKVQPYAGVDGASSLWDCCTQACNVDGTDGEVFIVFSATEDANRPIPLAVEVIDGMRCETPPKYANNPLVRMGIEKNSRGQIVAYHFQRSHPYDTVQVDVRYDRITADRVCHIYTKWYAGQSRGWSWLTRTLNRLKDVKDIDEAVVIAEQVAACYAGFIRTQQAGATAAAYGADGSDGHGNRYEDMRPGTLKYLGPGEDVQFPSPPNRGATLGPFMEWQHRRIAGGMNFPYEILAKNWSGTSFSGGRLVLAGAKLTVKAAQRRMIERFLSRWWRRMVFEGVMTGAVSIPPSMWRRYQYQIESHQWSAQPWPFALTPREEIEADITAIENNLDTKQRVVGERGAWFEDVFAQRQREIAAERELDIVPPERAKIEATAQPTADEAQQQQEAVL